MDRGFWLVLFGVSLPAFGGNVWDPRDSATLKPFARREFSCTAACHFEVGDALPGVTKAAAGEYEILCGQYRCKLAGSTVIYAQSAAVWMEPIKTAYRAPNETGGETPPSFAEVGGFAFIDEKTTGFCHPVSWNGYVKCASLSIEARDFKAARTVDKFRDALATFNIEAADKIAAAVKADPKFPFLGQIDWNALLKLKQRRAAMAAEADAQDCK